MRAVYGTVAASAVLVAAVMWSAPEEAAGRRADVVAWQGIVPHQQVGHCLDVFAAEVACEPERPIVAGAGVVIVDLVDGSDDTALAAASARIGATLRWVHPEAADEALAMAEVVDVAAAVAVLAGLPGVEVAEPSVALQSADVPPYPLSGVAADDPRGGWPRSMAPFPWGPPDDADFSSQWHLAAMGARSAWAWTPRGAGVVVAVVDTGVASGADFAAPVLPGVSFVPGVVSSEDDQGHGTHVAGTVAQATNNGRGAAGVAPGAAILPVKVLAANGAGTSEQVAAGIDWAVDHGAQVINLSLGGPVYSEVIHLAAKKARAAGVLVVAATGNDGKWTVSYPGALAEVIGVTATGPSGELAPYANWGIGTDVAAPGGDRRVEGGGVWQETVVSGGIGVRELQGTSMATPHVSGALAALLSAGLSADDAESALRAGADAAVWNPQTGHGRIDVDRSLTVVGLGGDRIARAGLGAALAWLLVRLAGGGPIGLLAGALMGAWSAGGLVGAETWGWPTLARAPLDLPTWWLGARWGALPSWVGGMLPLVAAGVLGLSRAGRPVVIGLSAGIAAHLLWGATHGRFDVWFLPGGWTSTWIGAQVVLSLLVALAVAGSARLDATGR